MSKVYSKPGKSFKMAYYLESILVAYTLISTTHSDLENVL
jgi:hypothetical protein